MTSSSAIVSDETAKAGGLGVPQPRDAGAPDHDLRDLRGGVRGGHDRRERGLRGVARHAGVGEAEVSTTTRKYFDFSRVTRDKAHY